MIEILSKHKVDVMKNSFKILMCMGIFMNTYAPIDTYEPIDVRIKCFTSVRSMKITSNLNDNIVVHSFYIMNNSEILDKNPHTDWGLRIYQNGSIEFLDGLFFPMKGHSLPSEKDIMILVKPILSYLIGKNSRCRNYLNNSRNRQAVLNFFANIPSDADQKAVQEMLRLKEKIQYDPTSSLFQTVTFLGNLRLFIGDPLISSTITSMFVWIFPFLMSWQLFIFAVGVMFHRHPLYFFDYNVNNKIMNYCLVPKWGGWFSNLFYWLIFKPKEVDFQPFNTYLPLISLYKGSNFDNNKLENFKKCLFEFKPSFGLQDIVDAFSLDLNCW